MKIEKLVITGAKGIIGSVLIQGLSSEYQITPLDLPEYDLRDFPTVEKALANHEAVIHLAWDTKAEHCGNREIDTGNIQMAHNIYRAAVQHNLRRVIMASSVHADDFLTWPQGGLMNPYSLPTPTSPYGASKVWIEAEGRDVAKHCGIEVVCVRFGGVRSNNITPNDANEQRVFLTNQDCVSAISTVLATDCIPDNYAIFYAVSNNHGKTHNTTNPFNWKPE